MTARGKRLTLILAALALLGGATALVLSAMRENLVFFHTPSEVAEGKAPFGRTFRIGGMVVDGSLERLPDGVTVRFAVTDTAKTIPVVYRGALPDLFSEGKGGGGAGQAGVGRGVRRERSARQARRELHAGGSAARRGSGAARGGHLETLRSA